MTTFEWELDGAGGDHGTARYHFMGRTVSLIIETFAKAHELAQAIDTERRNVRELAREELKSEIVRMIESVKC